MTLLMGIRSRFDDLKLALMILTRLPVGGGTLEPDATFARALWAYPIAGALVGAAGGAVFALAVWVRLPDGVAAAVALAAVFLTAGGIHEDGLSDFCDGLGGGRDRERKLAIMRDSRIGAYGALALVVSSLLRWSAIAALADPKAVLTVWIAAGALSRGVIALPLVLLPPARSDGLGVQAGSPPAWSVAGAVLIAIIIAAGLLGIGALPLVAAALAAAVVVTMLARYHLGGQTGDVLGACALSAECAALVIASGRWL